MIAICADRRTHRVRATSGYVAGPMPVLSRRDQPQCPGSAVPLRHERCRVAGHRADAAVAGVEGRQGRPAGGALPPGHRDAIRYLVKEGIQWRAMPCDFPPFGTVYDVLDRWEKSGATEMIHDELRRQCRIAAGHAPKPTAAIIDSQSVKAAETVARPGRGYDAGKKING